MAEDYRAQTGGVTPRPRETPEEATRRREAAELGPRDEAIRAAREEGFTHELSARTRARMAEQLDRAAGRTRREAAAARYDDGMRRRAAWAGDHAAERLHGAAEYVRGHGVHDMSGDLKRNVRDHPFAALALAAGTGYLFGKLFG